MNKLYTFIISLIVFLPSEAQAQKCFSDPGTGSFFSKICFPDTLTVTGLFVLVTNIIFGLTFTISVLFIIIGGVKYVVSAGNEELVESAKKTILNAVVGLVVTLLTVVVLNTVISLFKAG